MKYVVQPGDTLSGIAKKHKLSLDGLLELNPLYYSNIALVHVGAVLDVGHKYDNYFEVAQGQLTFDAEGTETEGRYFSRVAHVPGSWSGVTIGRGYDCKMKTEDKILADMKDAGVKAATAKALAGSSGLKGSKAKAYVEKNLKDAEITPRQQWLLFNKTYAELESDVKRICAKRDVQRKYGMTRWGKLPQIMRDAVVDLRYRGDYTPRTRERVQPLLVHIDLRQFKQLMEDEVYWVQGFKVPKDRFNRRAAHVNNLA